MATDQVIPGNGAAVVVNANFEAGRAAMMYGRRASTTGTPTALTWGYYGGQFGPGVAVADGALSLTNSATNYIVAARSNGAVSSATNTTNWSDASNYIQLYEVVASGGVVTSYTDRRPSVYNNSGGGGGGGGVVNSVVAGAGIDVDSTNPVNPEVSLDSSSIASLASADSALQSVQAGTNVTIDNTDPQNPIISASGGGGGGGTVTSVGVSSDSSVADLFVSQYSPVTTAGTIVLNANDLGADKLWGWDDSANKATGFAPTYGLKTNGTDLRGALQTLAIAASDLVTNISTGNGKAYFYAPYDFTVVEVQASLDTSQTAGSIFTVDINEAGTTILSTKLTIDNNEGSSITAATPPVISDASIAKGSKITIDVDQVGTAGARGLIVYLMGYPT